MNILELKSICKSFDGIDIIKNLNLTLQKGELACIFGASGCGKSTILYISSLLEKADFGEVFLDGAKMETEAQILEARRRSIGFIFQFHNLIPELTVMENILIAQKICNKNDKEFANFLLKELGMFEKRNAKPQTLSGGEAQRVAIIRAFAHKPQIIFADEPTGSLDPETGEKMIDLITSIAKEQNTAILAVSHNELFKAKFQTIFHLANKGLESLTKSPPDYRIYQT